MNWIEKALSLLDRNLSPVPSELNELDWKSNLSNKTDRLAQHISAFANLNGGGFLVFGVSDDGSLSSLQKSETDEIVRKLGNIASNSLSLSVVVEHEIVDYKGHPVLIVYIPEQLNKPVCIRSQENDIYNSYYRSAGQTRKMSKEQVHALLAESQQLSFERMTAKKGLTKSQVLSLLDYKKMCVLLDRNVPQAEDTIVSLLESHSYCVAHNDTYCITNLGAILFANHLSDFPSLIGKEVIVRKYSGTNNRTLSIEQAGSKGYASNFEELVEFIYHNTGKEQISIMRDFVPSYPKVTIREFLANCLVHQDFSTSGMPITVEIFTNRMVFTNPGASLNDVRRLIDMPPHSRNEGLAQEMLLLNMCERRGSGIDRAVEAIEKMLLPGYKVQQGENFTRVTIFPKKPLKELTKEEKIQACYQHACLTYEDNTFMTNQSVRERFGLDKNHSSVASRIISDTLDAGLIKVSNADSQSKKYASYIPFYG